MLAARQASHWHGLRLRPHSCWWVAVAALLYAPSNPRLAPALPCPPAARHAGVLHVCPSPHGLRPVAVVPLLRSPRLPPPLHRLACTASRAWCAPGQPGWGILELNGGWRFEVRRFAARGGWGTRAVRCDARLLLAVALPAH